ncbi:MULTISPECIES: flagellar hook-associated protein FlgK [unclassified Modestobacter]|uniref:flagellar hook-associated protein FlgK n=1 Tax=unclassified Modestobacter TaxID=2643866 RepID=UPI0022A9FF28|nr:MULTISPECIES: flagellar hook-associated protein FlgK [unclassified Modestobacter]MCZ2810394.1 flagellar hook-associated protein FlgK [Modestobacter sp. VKM Ac-2979]MCZ2841880.1 flagellar hook-associated protein FlgK [Modestobacter sp. VKM Ac-2980]MCZ2847065.1 flagellar hook-associated protein FlgK [Modestobacter sp. VKM Ac-2978]
MSSFSGLNTATTALWAQQRGLDVTGQNIANVNTAGYSRQRAELQSIGGNAVPAMYAISNRVGQGVDADKVIRIRDAFLEGRAQIESASTARMTAQDATLAQIEQAFREPGETGIQAKLTAVFTAWGDVANHPTEDGARTAVLQKTATLVAELHTTSSNLDKQWTQTRDSLDTLAQDVNAKTQSIADLNRAIKRATQAGLPVNELADKRDALVMDLATSIGATSSPGDDGQVNVSVAGATLVSGTDAIGIRAVGTAVPAEATATDPSFVTDPGGTRLALGGKAGGALTALSQTIPKYQQQLDGVAQRLADQVNAVHAGPPLAYDKNGAPGGPMFGSGTVPAEPITAANITLLITDPAKLAAASYAPIAGNASADAGNAAKLAAMAKSDTGVAVAYRQLIVDLGVEASVATSNLQTQTVVAAQVDASRESVSGVNLDEEMTNMLRFQHAYSAAARMITTIDETLDVLINRTGRVGL